MIKEKKTERQSRTQPHCLYAVILVGAFWGCSTDLLNQSVDPQLVPAWAFCSCSQTDSTFVVTLRTFSSFAWPCFPRSGLPALVQKLLFWCLILWLKAQFPSLRSIHSVLQHQFIPSLRSLIVILVWILFLVFSSCSFLPLVYTVCWSTDPSLHLDFDVGLHLCLVWQV